MRILITGATGVVGVRLIPILIRAGHAVTAVGRTPQKRLILERMGASAVEIDLFDRTSLTPTLRGQEAVINLATHIPPMSKLFRRSAWEETDRIRQIASAKLVDAALQNEVNVFIQESFAPVYADGADRWIDESWPMRPVKYNQTILDAERSAERFTEGGRRGIVLRFAAFYGPDAEQVIELVKFIRKGWVPVPGAGHSYFSSISHDDAASATAAAIDAQAGVYNVADDEPVPRREYFDSLAHSIGVKAPKLFPAWTAHLFGDTGELMSRSLRISNRKLREETGWRPTYPSIREGWSAVVPALQQAA
jgi:2-alkyl-3-oxoalkanoate reductase